MSEQAKKVSRQELYKKIWTTTLRQVAEDLGTTYAELSRVCDELNIPKPAPGYWQRLKLGLPVEVFPLPEPTPGMVVEGMLKPKGTPRNTTVSASENEMEKPFKPPVVAEIEPVGNAVQCESQAITEKRAASDPPTAEPEMPVTVEYTREQLYQALWSTPCTKLAAKLGISDVALAKTCRRLNVPCPPRGYWARVEAGEKPPKERLPAAKHGQDRVVSFDVAANVARREEWALNNVLTAGRSKTPNPIELPSEESELHPIAEKHRRILEKAKPGEFGFVTAKGKDLFWSNVSLTIVPRLIKALHAIICELEDRDYYFEPSDNEYMGLQISKDQDRVGLRWSESKIEIEREPTNVDKRKPSWTWQLKETKPAGKLTLGRR